MFRDGSRVPVKGRSLTARRNLLSTVRSINITSLRDGGLVAGRLFWGSVKS